MIADDLLPIQSQFTLDSCFLAWPSAGGIIILPDPHPGSWLECRLSGLAPDLLNATLHFGQPPGNAYTQLSLQRACEATEHGILPPFSSIHLEMNPILSPGRSTAAL